LLFLAWENRKEGFLSPTHNRGITRCHYTIVLCPSLLYIHCNQSSVLEYSILHFCFPIFALITLPRMISVVRNKSSIFRLIMLSSSSKILLVSCIVIILSSVATATAAATTDDKIIISAQEKRKEKANHWAVLVAGSKGYDNYRHQADTCHAYYLLRKNGYLEDHIIHMAYDDIAYHAENPLKGQLFNKPSMSGKGSINVYEGCKIDYRGEDVTPENLFRVLRGEGNTTNGLPVLKSDAHSNLFFYFADHGAPGLIRMPVEGESADASIYADQLQEVFTYMHTQKLYQEMVIYLETCESGSMFEHTLPPDLGIYAVTAANPTEASWGTYCGPFHNWVNHKSIKTCLGDLFSVNWMENIEAIMEGSSNSTNLRKKKAPPNNETLQDQYEIVMEETYPKSDVMQFGQLSMTKEPISNYYLSPKGVQQQQHKKQQHNTNQQQQRANTWWSLIKESSLSSKKIMQNPKLVSAVNSRDIKLHTLYSNIIMNPFSEEAYRAYNNEVQDRTKVDGIMQQLFPMMEVENETTNRIDFDCYRDLIHTYQNQSMCEPTLFTDYSMKYLQFFAAECRKNKNNNSMLTATKERMLHVCAHQSSKKL